MLAPSRYDAHAGTAPTRFRAPRCSTVRAYVASTMAGAVIAESLVESRTIGLTASNHPRDGALIVTPSRDTLPIGVVCTATTFLRTGRHAAKITACVRPDAYSVSAISQ